jgi:hypothetical protein
MGVDMWLHAFVIQLLHGGEQSASRHGRITPGENAPSTSWIEGLVGLRVCLDAVGRIQIVAADRYRNQDNGQSLYWRSYLAPTLRTSVFIPHFVNSLL